jgi:hypothetical protein
MKTISLGGVLFCGGSEKDELFGRCCGRRERRGELNGDRPSLGQNSRGSRDKKKTAPSKDDAV